MPISSRLIRLGIGTLAGFLACDLLLWPVPYSQVAMGRHPPADALYLFGALAGVLTALLVRREWRAPILAVVLGFVLAVMARVVVDTSRDPTSHNLWPFEVIIAIWFGGIAAVAGVGMVRLWERVTAPAAAPPAPPAP
ncbi:MAG: hypothetical protein ACHQXA_02465 [Gemmatimonadales bacterium]|jgi:hypothetical protein